MPGLTTEEIAGIALQVSGFPALPADSAVHVPGRNIRKLLFVMDATVGLLHLAKQSGFDAVLVHHPTGVLLHRGEVYRRHLDLLELHGVPRAEGLAAVGPAIDRVVRGMENKRFRMLPYESPNQTVLEVDVARFLGLPLLNVHNPCDEMGRRILQERIDRAAAAAPGGSLADLLALIQELPEAAYARQAYGIQPVIALGAPEAHAGRTVFVHGALSAPIPPIVRCYWERGVRTVVMLHGELETLEALGREPGGQLVLTGHYLGDSLGITPYLRALRAAGLEVTCMGGIIDLETQGA